MEWVVHGQRAVYRSPWVELLLADVQTPTGHRFEHHVVRAPRHAVNIAVRNDADRVLMLWRHRFIVNHWCWELPAGWVDDGETPEQAARREVKEETGWRIGTDLTCLGVCNADNGLADIRTHLFTTRDAAPAGPPRDIDEAAHIEWIPLADIPDLIRAGLISDAPIMVTLLLALHHAGSSQRPVPP